jgi:hypothetical protein
VSFVAPAFDSAPLIVRVRSLPPFPLHSLAGAVDGGGGAGWDGSGADCSAGGARAGVSLPGVLSTRVFVLFRPRGIEGRSGESGTRSISFSDVVTLTLLLLVILLILQLSRLQTAGIQSLSTMQLTLELPARSSILLNSFLNDLEALEQTPALQTLETVLLTLKDLTSCRSYKPGGLCVLRQSNIGGGFLDIQYKEQHQKRLYRLATARLRKNNIDTTTATCVCAPLRLSNRGVGGVGLGGCCQWGAPESNPKRPSVSDTVAGATYFTGAILLMMLHRRGS